MSGHDRLALAGFAPDQARGDPHATNQGDMSVMDYLDDVLSYREGRLGPGFRTAVDLLRRWA